MKKLSRCTSCFIAVILFITFMSFNTIASSADKSKTITVDLSPYQNDALGNYKKLRDALSNITSNNLKVKIKNKGKYYIDTTGASLKLHSNTTLDLNESTIIRYGEMLNQNMFQNCDLNGERKTGGYSLSKNITIKNGTVDGNGSSSSKGVNLINFGHATNINLSNLNFKNSNQGHLIELSGCQNSVIKNCTFKGFYGKADGNNEAIQLDICKKTWNGIYLSDSSVCNNIIIEDCTFYDYPSGVGNHHTLTGTHHNQNITIIRNKFYNSKNYGIKGPAIRCYGFNNSTIKDNIINGIYSDGIKISGGNVDVVGNKINLNSIKGSTGIYITYSSSNKYTESENLNNNRINEYVSGGEICKNAITNYGLYGVSVNTKSKINSISSNKISYGKGTGIFITKSTVTGNINGNEISNCSYNSNDNRGSGIHITSTSWVKTIQSNSICLCAEYGIAHYSTKTNVVITNNILSNNRSGNLKVSAKGTIRLSNVKISNVTGFKASATNSSAVKLTWSKVSGAKGYVVYQKKSGKWTRIKVTSSNSYTVSKLKSGTTYQFCIKPYTKSGSKTVYGNTSKTLTTSTNPATVNFKLSAGSRKATVKWNKLTGASGYRIYYKTSKNGSWKYLKTVNNKTTSFTKTGLTKGKTYYFTVKAYRTTGGKTYNGGFAAKSVKIK